MKRLLLTIFLLICLMQLASCASYLVEGNWGGPNGGGEISPDSKHRAYVHIAHSNRYKLEELSPYLVRIWIANGNTFAVLNEKRTTIEGYFVRWKVVWRDESTVDYEFYDYGDTVDPLVDEKKVSPSLRRVLATHTLHLSRDRNP
jgi:hypothetical protein